MLLRTPPEKENDDDFVSMVRSPPLLLKDPLQTIPGLFC